MKYQFSNQLEIKAKQIPPLNHKHHNQLDFLNKVTKTLTRYLSAFNVPTLEEFGFEAKKIVKCFSPQCERDVLRGLGGA